MFRPCVLTAIKNKYRACVNSPFAISLSPSLFPRATTDSSMLSMFQRWIEFERLLLTRIIHGIFVLSRWRKRELFRAIGKLSGEKSPSIADTIVFMCIKLHLSKLPLRKFWCTREFTGTHLSPYPTMSLRCRKLCKLRIWYFNRGSSSFTEIRRRRSTGFKYELSIQVSPEQVSSNDY